MLGPQAPAFRPIGRRSGLFEVIVAVPVVLWLALVVWANIDTEGVADMFASIAMGSL